MASGRRAEQQRINRERILAAAREEFAEVGYRGARIDGIAARAGLTRGAVYSNFPGKRALGLTVAADLLSAGQEVPPGCMDRGGPPDGAARERGASPGTLFRDQGEAPWSPDRSAAVASMARAWLSRLPLGEPTPGRIECLPADLYAEIREDRDLRDACAELLRLDAVLLARALEQLPAGDVEADADEEGRQVRAASSLLGVLHAASGLGASAPGFTDPFDVVTACRALAAADFGDRWSPPDESIVPAVRRADRAWDPPECADLITGAPVDWSGDGVVAVLGLRRASAVEQALRGARPGERVTLVLVSDDPAERAPLASLVLAELLAALRPGFPEGALAGLAVVLDREGRVADAAGMRSAHDDACLALRLEGGHVVAQAEGAAACHAVAGLRSDSVPGCG
jgi:AcrR family transcriptional regulator